MSARWSPATRRFNASHRWKPESFGLRPNLTPFARARLRPSPVLSRIREDLTRAWKKSAKAENLNSLQRGWTATVQRARYPQSRGNHRRGARGDRSSAYGVVRMGERTTSYDLHCISRPQEACRGSR